MSVPTAWLEDANGRRWPVPGTASLGRSTSNDVVIDDGKVSRRHALVHKQDEAEYWVIDLGSGNGTYLNGRRVIQPTRLANGDVLLLGEHSLSFQQIAARPADPGATRSSAQTIINVKSIDCWLLVADIKGSTGLAARLSSTDMAMLVGRWMGACKEIVDGHGGSINKFLGDGFFAYWPAATTGPGDIVRALEALKAHQAANREPRFRIVLHFGAVALGGGGSLGEDSLSGIDVVLAFRMEKIAGEIGCDLMLSEEVRGRLGGAVAVRDLGTHAVQGFTGPARRFYGSP